MIPAIFRYTTGVGEISPDLSTLCQTTLMQLAFSASTPAVACGKLPDFCGKLPQFCGNLCGKLLAKISQIRRKRPQNWRNKVKFCNDYAV